MASVSITIDDKELQEKLKTIVTNLKNKTPFHKKALIFMRQDVLKHFEEKKGSKSKWPEVSKKYALIKSGQGKDPSNLLQFSGRLRQSISELGKATEDEASVGTNIIYGATHQFGRGNIPQREFLWLSSDAKDKIVELAKKYFFEDA